MTTSSDRPIPTAPAGSTATHTVQTTLEIAGQRVDISLSVPDAPVRIAEMVPVAQAVSEKIGEVVCEQQQQKNAPVACRKGCSACCNYLVALSRPEMTYLREQLSYMDRKYQHAVLRACVMSARKILRNSDAIDAISRQTDPQQLSRWYAGLNLTCPFLTDGICGIYEHRPLACREHLVSGDAALCDSTRPGRPNVIKPPVSVLEALGQLDAELNQSDVEAVILPLALIETNDNDKQTESRWNAVEMTHQLLEIIKKKTANITNKPVCLDP